MENKCKCFGNPGISCFTGNCSVCGLRKDNMNKFTPEQIAWIKEIEDSKRSTILEKFKESVLSLISYTPDSYLGLSIMVPSNAGEYVKLSDVLSLFRGQKEIRGILPTDKNNIK